MIVKNVYTWIMSQDTKKSDKSHKQNAFQKVPNSSSTRGHKCFIEQRRMLFVRSKKAFRGSFRPLQTLLNMFQKCFKAIQRVILCHPPSDFTPSSGLLYGVQRVALCLTPGTLWVFLECFFAPKHTIIAVLHVHKAVLTAFPTRL